MVIQNKKRQLVHLLIVVFVVSVISVIYQKTQATSEWKNLGPAGFSDGTVDEASIAIHECDDVTEQPNQNPATSEINNSESLNQSTSFSYYGGGTDTGCVEVYVGFRDLDNGSKMSVMKYDSTNETWDYVGGRGFTAGKTYHTDLAVNSQNVPYVIFADYPIGQKLRVMKYVASTNKWENVGNPVWAGQDTSIKFDNNDVPYVSFAYDSRSMVMKFDGNDWVEVGQVNSSLEISVETALLFDSNNIPYIAYTRNDDTYGITVKKWNEPTKSWDQIGKSFSKRPNFISLKLDSNNVPYISFVANSSTVVSMFDGGKWVDISNPINSQNPSALILGLNNEPYLFFSDSNNNYLGVVQKFNGSKWVDFGNYTFPTDYASIYDNKAIVSDSKGNLFNTFEDASKNGKISVMTTSNIFQKPSWQNVGSSGFTSGVANFISLNIDSQNNKYVAFQDYANKAKASVMKFDGTAWGYVGTAGFSSGVASQISSVIDLNNNLYVAYQDGAIGGKATVKKWNGASWANLGIPGFSTGSVSGTNIKVDTTGNPYISYLQGTNTIVKKYNTGNNLWDDVATSSLPKSREATLGIDQNNVPHIALRDVLNGDKLTVMAYNDLLKKWELVGPTAGFSAGTVGNLSLAFGSNNGLEVAFSDGSKAGKVTAMYFDGKDWVNSGNPGFSSGRAGFISMDIDTRDPWNNISYVSFVDYSNAKKISTMKYDPIKGWVTVGNTIGPGLYSSLKLDSNGAPFNVFQDASKGNKATLMKYE